MVISPVLIPNTRSDFLVLSKHVQLVYSTLRYGKDTERLGLNEPSCQEIYELVCSLSIPSWSKLQSAIA